VQLLAGSGRLCAKAYEQVASVTAEFIGDVHIACIIKLLGPAELPLVIEGVLQVCVHTFAKLLTCSVRLVDCSAHAPTSLRCEHCCYAGACYKNQLCVYRYYCCYCPPTLILHCSLAHLVQCGSTTTKQYAAGMYSPCCCCAATHTAATAAAVTVVHGG
jgi:hypothetical protein